MFKKYIQLLVGLFISTITSLVYWASTAGNHRESMLPNSKWTENGVVTSKIWVGSWDNAWEDQVYSIFAWIRDSMESLLPIVAVGVFLFVGIRIAMARWNPEEFKKAWMQMVYAVVGIFVVGFAWAAVKLVAGLNI